MEASLLKCLRQAQAVCLAGLFCWLVAGGVITLLAVADLVPLSANAAASEAGKRFQLTDLIVNEQAIAEAIAYQVYSPSAAAKGAFVFNEPNAYYGSDPTTYRGAGMSRNLAAWDLLKAAAIPFGIMETSGGVGGAVPARHSRLISKEVDTRFRSSRT